MAKSAGIHQYIIIKQVCLPLTLIVYLYHGRYYVSGGEQIEELILVNGCACLNETITYECTVKGGIDGATLWSGSAFNCSGNDVIILHNPHVSGVGTCNDGAIVAQRLWAIDGFYTSQLNVTINSSVIGKSVECAYVYSQTTTRIGTQTIAASNSPPDKLYISLADFRLNRLSFTWSPVAVQCPRIEYNILTSNCGSCPTTTNHTTVTCTDFITNGTKCTFALQTVICENITSNVSDPVSITFYATDVITASMDILYPTENRATHNSDTTETVGIGKLDANIAVYRISIGSLATALIISIVVFITVIMIIVLRRSKVRIKAALQQLIRAGETTHIDEEPVYEDITGRLPSVSIISTQDNTAYCLARTIPAT